MDDHRGWYEGRNLPHYDVGDITQFVTFRLGDSLPQEALERLEEELKGVKQNRDVERVARIEKFLDQGSGSCILREADCANIVKNSLLYLDGKRYDLHA